MNPWDPNEYLRFGDERTRPSVDLATRIAVERPANVIDLGCGPGNSTLVLQRRWPESRVVGVDSSAEMIDAARSEYPDGEWVRSGIEEWCPAAPFDVVFSNAALQWLPGHGPLVERLFASVAAGGALAFQIPAADFSLVRTLMRDVALGGPWAPRMEGPIGELTMESPDFYYDHLAPLARSVDIWVTEYSHVMDSHDAIVDWISSTGMRVYLAALNTEDEKQRFAARFRERVQESYEVRSDGRVLFPFKRMFVIAYA